MWRITLKGVLAHRLRYALTALSVLLGVAFIAGTLTLRDTTQGAFNNLYDQVYGGTAAVVRATQSFNPGISFTSTRPRISASLLQVVDKVPGVAAADGGISGYAQLVAKDGRPIGVTSNGPPTLGVSWTGNPALSQLRVLPGGRPPRASDEVVIDKHSADVGHFTVGDKVRVLTQGTPGTYVITGIATWGGADSPLGASITAFTPATAQRLLSQPGMVDEIDVQAASGVPQDTLVTRIQAALAANGSRNVEVITGQAVAAEGQQAIRQGLSIIFTFLLVFAFIAVFVGAFVIVNTFSIVVAQRLRELALLRAVGASRRQVTATVVGESLVIGAVASLAGVGAGVALAIGLKAAMSAMGYGFPGTGMVVTLSTVVTSLLVGVAVTVAAALGPAIRASRVPPVAALQEVAAEPPSPPSRRLAWGLPLAAGGVVLLGLGLFSHMGNRVALTGGGLVALFVAVAVLGPFAARSVIGPLGALVAGHGPRRGPTGRIGRSNAMRNPSRTASTAAALMVGMALVSVMTILVQSYQASAGAMIDNAIRADYIISTSTAPGAGSGLSPLVERQLAALPMVRAVAGARGGIARVFGGTTSVVATQTAVAAPLVNIGLTQGSLAAMTNGGIAVSTKVASAHQLRLGSLVAVTYPAAGTHTYTVQAIYSDNTMAGDYVLPISAAASFPQSLDMFVYVRVAPGTAATARAAIQKVLSAYPVANLMDEAQFRNQQEQQISQLLNLVYLLLALAVLIALIGIANTLALSVHERTRELGLLRAVGTTRGQLRAIVRAEALVISLFGAVEGLVLGVLFGWAVVASMHSSGVSRLVIPVPQLVLLTALASLAGLLASVAPSRRAARLNILRAVTTE